ncbi:uncharacterized protein Z518_02513 [Rhinocladiella mackenziei CBS 650.93]|uniref:Uncharacterized protein n=1 Tax=Rhinocladiella mackenziei CBS 650.93 TaxID=1442369 RepID=A0A0D2IPN7_9EURO|nr:uncharacterized protein Z518_02513 [Rhinocladiella mackenziei CBS 650.93]KIX07859.1 hypothetical protein Z518_02513 [Rhinocladiella mackenziei CBS 650.93]
MYKRQNQIKLAHAKTFDWVFRTQGTTPWDDFVEWTHQGTSPYWVLGKPDCGKSTFMKFPASHPKTTSHMKARYGGPDGGSDPSVFELMVATDKEVRHIYLEKGLDDQEQMVHVQYGPLGFRVDDSADATDLLDAGRALAPWLYTENMTPFPGNIYAAHVELGTKVKEIQDRSIQQDAFKFLLDRGWIKYLDDDEVLHQAPLMQYANAPTTPDLFREPEENPITSAMAALTTETRHLGGH